MKKIILITGLVAITGCSSYFFSPNEKDIIDSTSELNEHSYKNKNGLSDKEKKGTCFDFESKQYKDSEQIEHNGLIFECREDYDGAWVSEHLLQ